MNNDKRQAALDAVKKALTTARNSATILAASNPKDWQSKERMRDLFSEQVPIFVNALAQLDELSTALNQPPVNTDDLYKLIRHWKDRAEKAEAKVVQGNVNQVMLEALNILQEKIQIDLFNSGFEHAAKHVGQMSYSVAATASSAPVAVDVDALKVDAENAWMDRPADFCNWKQRIIHWTIDYLTSRYTLTEKELSNEKQ